MLFNHHPYIAALIIVALFTLDDRWRGGGLGWKPAYRGRPSYYSTLPGMGAMFLLGGVPLMVLYFAWGLYRSALGFPTNTLTGRDLKSTWLHHMIWPVAALVLAAVFHWPAAVVIPSVLYAGAAVALAKWNGDAIKAHGDINGRVELIRGACMGAATAAALALA